MANWVLTNKKADISAMAKTLGTSEIFSRILVNRNINTKRKFKDFINPSFEQCEDIKNMKGVNEAFAIIRESLLKGDKIVIYGDYDADGVMSCAILVKGLSAISGKVSFYIPLRQEEGYGLNMGALDKIAASGCNLLILCDNGISAYDEVKKAREYGITVIIIDHHEPPLTPDDNKEDIIPPANAVIDPKQKDCPYNFKAMCAAGLCFRIIRGFYENYEIEFTLHKELVILAAIATFCDIVDLTGDNRVITYHGLEALNNGDIPNPGLKSLIARRNYQNKYIDEFAIGFIIGPCINASGRLESASISVELMLSKDSGKCDEYANLLSSLNEERKALTTAASDFILEELVKNPIDKVIVVYNEDIHESVAGIVAGRIKERLYRPAIVIAKGEDCAKGSGRSIAGYNMFEALSECRELFLRFGGHAMAAGFSIDEKNIPELSRRLNDTCLLTEDDLTETIYVDSIVSLSDITFKLYEEIRKIRPFGKENKEPLLSTLNACILDIRLIDDKNTIIFGFAADGGRKVKGICFGKNEYFKKIISEHYDDYDCEKIFAGNLRGINLLLDIVYYLSINEYNNDVSLQLSLKDFRFLKNKSQGTSQQ